MWGIRLICSSSAFIHRGLSDIGAVVIELDKSWKPREKQLWFSFPERALSEFHLEGKEEKTKPFEERGSEEFLLDNCREGKTTGTQRVKIVKETRDKRMEGRKDPWVRFLSEELDFGDCKIPYLSFTEQGPSELWQLQYTKCSSRPQSMEFSTTEQQD